MALNSYDFPVKPDFSPASFKIYMDNKDPCTKQITAKTGRITRICQIKNAANVYQYACYLLGFAYVDDSNNLIRVPPMCDVEFPNMICTDVSDARGVQFAGKTDINEPGCLPSAPDYNFADLTLTFEPVPFLTVASGAYDPTTSTIITNYQNYVSYKFGFNAQALKRETGTSLQWAESWGTAGTTGPVIGQPVAGTVFVTESHADLAVTWHCVPEEYVVNVGSGSILSPKIMKAIGTVNSGTFLGCPANTLLMKPPIIERYISPLVASANQGRKFLLDITFMLDYFAPVQGALIPFSAGHQTAPFFPTGGTALQILYGFLSSSGSSSGTPIYPSTDFTTLFTYWNS